MSDSQPSEYLKRTCLICGCHTNQTINIYEPRSGPNIVKLIQAKFKFQPLNEDKYLCFSCNNWLINWHSLQALNSNDAESPSGTFRSNVSNQVAHDKSKNERSDLLLVNNEAIKPIAHVKPQQHRPHCDNITSGQSLKISAKNEYPSKSLPHHMMHKSLQSCRMCGRPIIVRSISMMKEKMFNGKCRKCRDVCKWRALTQLKKLSTTVYKSRELRFTQMKMKNQKKQKNSTSMKPSEEKAKKLVKETHLIEETPTKEAIYQSQSLNVNIYTDDKAPNAHWKSPLVDGKIVSMLRRIGTTLSREVNNSDCDRQPVLPPIMSPVQSKPRWPRQLEEDEILLDFNTAISEVLPKFTPYLQTKVDTTMTRDECDIDFSLSDVQANDGKQIIYQMSPKERISNEVLSSKHTYKFLSNGLTVSAISC